MKMQHSPCIPKSSFCLTPPSLQSSSVPFLSLVSFPAAVPGGFFLRRQLGFPCLSFLSLSLISNALAVSSLPFHPSLLFLLSLFCFRFQICGRHSFSIFQPSVDAFFPQPPQTFSALSLLRLSLAVHSPLLSSKLIFGCIIRLVLSWDDFGA